MENDGRHPYGMRMAPVTQCGLSRRIAMGAILPLARYAEFSSRPYREVLDEVFVRNTAILIVDPIVYDGAGWNNFLLVAIHEGYFLGRKAQAMNCFNRNAIPLYDEEP